MGIVPFEVVEEYRNKFIIIYPGVVAMVSYPMVFRSEFSVAGIAFGCVLIVFNVFGRHFDRFCGFEPIVYIANFLLKKVYKLFGNVFSLILLGIVYQLGFIDGIVETLNIVAKSAGIMLLVLGGA